MYSYVINLYIYIYIIHVHIYIYTHTYSHVYAFMLKNHGLVYTSSRFALIFRSHGMPKAKDLHMDGNGRLCCSEAEQRHRAVWDQYGFLIFI